MNEYISYDYDGYDNCENCDELRSECICPDGCCPLSNLQDDDHLALRIMGRGWSVSHHPESVWTEEPRGYDNYNLEWDC